MTTRLHRGKRSRESKELRLARKIAFENSFRTQDPDEIKETVFISNSELLGGEVLARLKGEREDEIPEIPQGLVLSNGRGEGFFDVNLSP
jgi:hypothetical protein